MFVEVWYDEQFKTWVIYRMDSEGNQIGEAEYEYLKKNAILEAYKIKEQENATVKIFNRYGELQKTV